MLEPSISLTSSLSDRQGKWVHGVPLRSLHNFLSLTKCQQLGQPLNIEFFGGPWDFTTLYRHITPERHWEAIVVTTEALTRDVLPAASRVAGHHISGAFVIADLKGFGYASPFLRGFPCHGYQFVPVLANKVFSASNLADLAGLLPRDVRRWFNVWYNGVHLTMSGLSPQNG